MGIIDRLDKRFSLRDAALGVNMNYMEQAVYNARLGSPTGLVTSVPSDNGAILANPMMGLELVHGLTGNKLLTAAITAVSGGTFSVNTTDWDGFAASTDYPHFDADCNWLGVLRTAAGATGSPVSYTVVSGSDPVVGGYILRQRLDWSLCRCKFSWAELEPVARDTFAWDAMEISSGIKVVREMNAHNWGIKKQFILNLILDYPLTSNVHRDIPAWLYALTGDGVDYAIPQNGYCPNYSNATLISEHGRVLAALGARYASDPLFALAMFGSIGHWGENHYDSSLTGTVPFPTNAVVNQYLQHYVDAFTGAKCITRRSIGNSGTMGMGVCMHGAYNTAQVFQIANGSIDGLNKSLTDLYGISQAAIANWKTRMHTGEPYSAPLDYPFANEPTNLVPAYNGTNWVTGALSSTIGSALTESANTTRFRTAAGVAILPNTTYTVRRRKGTSGADNGGYRCRIYVTDSGNILRYQNSGLDDGATFTTPANAAFIRFGVDEDKAVQGTMTLEKVIDAFPRLYAGTFTNANDRNIAQTMKQVNDYGFDAFCFDPHEYRKSGTNAVQANVETFHKRLGYRLRPSAVSLSGNVLSVTVANGGCAYPHCGDRRVAVGLLQNGAVATTVWSDARVDDIAPDVTKVITIRLPPKRAGEYLIAIGFAPYGVPPDIAVPAEQVIPYMYQVGTITYTP